MGHGCEADTRATAKKLNWVITRGSFGVCLHCAKAKAKQKNVCKASESPKATTPGGRLYLDLSKVTVPTSEGGEYTISQKWWEIMVDENTGKKWSSFSRTKNEMVETTCEFFNLLKSRDIPVLKVRLDPAGENHALEKRAQTADWAGLQPIIFEFTSRDTPQHNALAELAFPYLSGLARSMMNGAYVPPTTRAKVAIEAIKTATSLDGLRVVTLGGKEASRDEHVFGSNPSWVDNMHTFGEAAVVTEGKNSKTGDRGVDMMFVGYTGRESDSFKFWNPVTNGVVNSRDAIFLKRMFYEKLPDAQEVTWWDEDPARAVDAVTEEPSEADEEEQVLSDAEDAIVDMSESAAGETVTQDAVVTRSGRTSRPRMRLIEEETNAVQLHYQAMMHELDNVEVANAVLTSSEVNFELQLVGAGLGGGFEHTSELKVKNYKQAMAGKDAAEWKVEVGSEKKRFDRFNAFTPFKRSELPANEKVMTTTWAMKKKASGERRARLNARGYEQREGVHYNESNIAAPVTNACSCRIALTLMGSNPIWVAEIVDVDGAFLQGRFVDGEILYIEVPAGFHEYYEDDVVFLRLNVPIYGTK